MVSTESWNYDTKKLFTGASKRKMSRPVKQAKLPIVQQAKLPIVLTVPNVLSEALVEPPTTSVNTQTTESNKNTGE